jgi:hypothetical protein
MFVTLIAASIPGDVTTLPALDQRECDVQHNAAVLHRNLRAIHEECQVQRAKRAAEAELFSLRLGAV